MRAPVLAGGIVATVGLLAGCAHMPGASAKGQRTITARVIAAEEITVFVGDVATVWTTILVEPDGKPDRRMRVLTDRVDCPKKGETGGVYQLDLQYRMQAYGLTENQDATILSQWVVTGCHPA